MIFCSSPRLTVTITQQEGKAFFFVNLQICRCILQYSWDATMLRILSYTLACGTYGNTKQYAVQLLFFSVSLSLFLLRFPHSEGFLPSERILFRRGLSLLSPQLGDLPDMRNRPLLLLIGYLRRSLGNSVDVDITLLLFSVGAWRY